MATARIFEVTSNKYKVTSLYTMQCYQIRLKNHALIPVRARDVSLLNNTQRGSGPLPTSYSMGTGGSFLWVKVTGT
jgi:hypothetical protein